MWGKAFFFFLLNRQPKQPFLDRHMSPIMEAVPPWNSAEHKDMYFCLFIFHQKGFLTPHCGSLSHHSCLSCSQGALQTLPRCGNVLEGSSFWELCESLLTAPNSHWEGYQQPCFPKCSRSSH